MDKEAVGNISQTKWMKYWDMIKRQWSDDEHVLSMLDDFEAGKDFEGKMVCNAEIVEVKVDDCFTLICSADEDGEEEVDFQKVVQPLGQDRQLFK